MGRIGIHGHDFLADFLFGIGKVDAVAKGLAHLGFAVCTGETQAGLVIR